jgi:hypothetical protein
MIEQALYWLVPLALIGLVFWLVVRENSRRQRRTVQEWERDFAAGQGKASQFIRAGALGLESIFVDEKRQAIEFMKDEQQGMTKAGGKDDDADRTATKE